MPSYSSPGKHCLCVFPPTSDRDKLPESLRLLRALTESTNKASKYEQAYQRSQHNLIKITLAEQVYQSGIEDTLDLFARMKRQGASAGRSKNLAQDCLSDLSKDLHLDLDLRHTTILLDIPRGIDLRVCTLQNLA